MQKLTVPPPSMRTLVSQKSEPHFHFNFPSISSSKRKPIFILHYKSLSYTHKSKISSSFKITCTANSAASCNGWDDLSIRDDSDELGESNYLKKFLISLGIDDKKYIFTCILGFVCALAISRVRVSSIIVFPATAIVFAVGFWFGFANGRSQKGLNLYGIKRRSKDDSLRVYFEILKNLVGIFDGFDVKISDLKNDIKNAIIYERADFGDLESYVNAIDTIDGLILNARSLVEGCIGGTLFEVQELEKNANWKNSRKKKENGDKGFDMFEFVGSFFKDNVGDSKSSRTNFVKRDYSARDVVDQGQEDSQSSEGSSDQIPTVDSSTRNRKTLNESYGKKGLEGRDQEKKRVFQSAKVKTMEAFMNTNDFLNDEEYNYQDIRYTSDQRMSGHMENRKWASDESMSSDTEVDISKEFLENEGFLKNQDIFQNCNGAYKSFEGRESVNIGRFRASIQEERINLEDEMHSRKFLFQSDNDLGPFSSSAVSDDLLFDKCLTKANSLLKQAKECLKARNDETLTEEMLYESAKLLYEAIALKPMSLLAIGELGNTYLLHGELKLKISRKLRRLLSKSDGLGRERNNFLILEDTFPSNDRIKNLLISECEECEALLVEAGRKYRMALSINGNDLRALYNWGLALSFRAELIADVGPEAALDADKLFLAAIDKYNAMMSRSNAYAPEALFRWGMALQQRSLLRPSNSRDKLKLLQQAKRLYEDALNMGSNTLQVREALSSCISELNLLY